MLLQRVIRFFESATANKQRRKSACCMARSLITTPHDFSQEQKDFPEHAFSVPDVDLFSFQSIQCAPDVLFDFFPEHAFSVPDVFLIFASAFLFLNHVAMQF